MVYEDRHEKNRTQSLSREKLAIQRMKGSRVEDIKNQIVAVNWTVILLCLFILVMVLSL